MSALDPTTLLLVSSVVVSLGGVTFILATVLRRNDLVGRLWSIFYVGTIFSVFGMIVGDTGTGTWWAFAAGSGFFVAALGLIWAGTRAANRRPPLIAILAAIAAGVTVVTLRLIAGPVGASAHGSVEMFVGTAAFFGLAAFESSRGALAKLSGGRVLAALLGLAGFYYLVRAVSQIVLGPDHPTFQIFFGPSTASLLEIGVAVIGTLGLMSIQDDRFRQASVAEAEFGARVAIDGILVRETFQELAETWLMRSIRERTTLALVVIEIGDLSEINVAFGRAAGDAALRTVGRLALMNAPTASLLGHITPRRFAILMELPTHDSVEAILDRMADAVLGTPIDDQDRFRAAVFSGFATTRASGARYQDLLRDAKARALEEREAARERAENARTGGVLTRN